MAKVCKSLHDDDNNSDGKAAYSDDDGDKKKPDDRTGSSSIINNTDIIKGGVASLSSSTTKVVVDHFAKSFHAPGHVPILIAAKNLLSDRKGHTELCIYLLRLAGMAPAVTICEMMDSQTYGSLSIEKALEYARKFDLPLVEASELKEAHQKAKVK
jgi:3,4-dihydroxy 2-butanone 4-phosphate synthase